VKNDPYIRRAALEVLTLPTAKAGGFSVQPPQPATQYIPLAGFALSFRPCFSIERLDFSTILVSDHAL
jgi:hypothetical protein